MAVHSHKLGAVNLVILPVDVGHIVRQLVQKDIHAGAVVAPILINFEIKRGLIAVVPTLAPPQRRFPGLVDDDDLDSLTVTDRTVFMKIGYAWMP